MYIVVCLPSLTTATCHHLFAGSSWLQLVADSARFTGYTHHWICRPLDTLSVTIGSCGSVAPPDLPACPLSPHRLSIACQELSSWLKSAGILKNASTVYPE